MVGKKEYTKREWMAILAAASDLYEELQVMVVQLGFHKLTPADKKAIEQAKKAIAKAEGK